MPVARSCSSGAMAASMWLLLLGVHLGLATAGSKYVDGATPDASTTTYRTVPTKNGGVKGFLDNGVYNWLGIPYAAAPTGNNRFRPPQPKAPWNTTLDTLSFKSQCLQIHVAGGIILGSEDCLYLNVHVPESFNPDTDPPLPVMVWIYGGGYIFGDAYEYGLYDATNLVKKHNVIIVEMNYRLSAFGFLALEQLQAEDPHKSTGNYGVQDQHAALEWVQDNIAYFGGNASRVMLFGESAGAFSVCWHMVNSQSKGLFQAALMESGTCDSIAFFQPFKLATSFGDMFANAIGCNSSVLSPPDFLSCLRKLDAHDVIKTVTSWLNPDWPNPKGQPPTGWLPPASPVMPWGPAIDGSVIGLEGLPLDLMKAGKTMPVPLVIGTNQNEGDIFVPAIPVMVKGGVTFPLTEAGFNLTMLHFFNQTTLDVLAKTYPDYDFKSQDARASRVLRDFIFVCPTRRIAITRTSLGLPVFVYHFKYKGDWVEDPVLGNYHSAELEYVWDNQWPPLVHIFSDKDKTLASTFGYYWTNHARFGSPNGLLNDTHSPLYWPQWANNKHNNLIMDVPTSVQSDYVESQCDVWDTIAEKQ